jgi:biopolymer transport protein ExbB/TolQ
MAAFLREVQMFNADDWVWLMVLLTAFFVGVVFLIITIFKGLRQLKLYVGKDGIKINDSANSKLDQIIERLSKLERDVVALQIMNEQLTPEQRLERYDYYKFELHGNSFIDEYIKTIKKQIDTSRFS